MQKVKRARSSKEEHAVPEKTARTDKPVAKQAEKKKKFSKPDKPKPLQKSVSKFNKAPNSNKPQPFNADGKPTDWNEFKKKKKVVRDKRKQSRNLYDVITRAKQIGEKLRVKKLEGGNKERSSLIEELHDMMTKNGGYVKFVLAHDMARIVQYMLKFGSAVIREQIANELIPTTVQMLQSKYGKFCVKRMLKYGNASVRSQCIRATYGNAVKLTSHAVSAPVFEYAYSTWASPLDKISLIQEFFGDVYKQTKDVTVKHLRDVYKSSPEMKAAALSATKANLSRILNKDLLDSGLAQSVLWQFLTECSAEDRSEMISQLAAHIVVISNSKDGARAAMQCIWHGTNKDRKVAMKALKENAIELCKHEHGHCMIIALLDAIDDTVLLHKMIFGDILSRASELVADDWGRKVLLWLVHPADTAHFHPLFISELEAGRKGSSCKKEAEVRRKELLSYSSASLLQAITAEPKTWLDQASKAVVTLSILKSGSGPDLQSALKSVSEAIVDRDWKLKHEDTEMCVIEHPGIHMTLKKLAQNDAKRTSKDDSFGEALVELLTDKVIKSWVKLNRGCFLLVIVYENNSEDVQKKLKEKLLNHSSRLKKQTHMGANILCKKIEAEN